MKGAEKARLRNTLRKLRALRVAPDLLRSPALAQEMLDFLAVLAGIKPVWVLGRGLDDPAWRDGAVSLAGAMKLHVIEGALWLAPDAFAGLPGWYADAAQAPTAGQTAQYICRTRAMADQVRALGETGSITIAQEARLLGFPECCVADHYARARALHGAMYATVQRAGGGDARRMRDMVANADVLSHAEPAERAAIAAAISLVPAPFTSLNMCGACADTPESPAAQLARRFAALALDVDRALYDELLEGAG